MVAGTAEVIITPPAGAPMLGPIQRSNGVHDDLYARALVLNDRKQRVAIYALIWLGWPLLYPMRYAMRFANGRG